jgi:hypothetical protein
VSLEKVFDVEVGGKEYKIEMDNMALIRFERSIERSWLDWGNDYIHGNDGEGMRWQPPFEDAIKFLISALKKHQPKLKFTVESIANSEDVTVQNIYNGELGISMLGCYLSLFPDVSDLESSESESAEAGEDDPLDEKPNFGQT